MSSIDLRASSSSGSKSWSELPPRSDENVRQSLATAAMSSWRVMAQKPRPSCSSCQWTGSSWRKSANISCGTPAANRVVGVESDRLPSVASQVVQVFGQVPVGGVLAAALELEALQGHERLHQLVAAGLGE